MKLKLSNIAIGLALALGLGAGSAQAASVSSLIQSYGFFQLEDDNGEMQGVDLNGNSQLDVGDTLVGVIEFGKINQLSAPFNSALLDGVTNSHLSAVFTTKVTGRVAGSGVGMFDYTFGADSLSGLGTMISFYENATDPLNILGCLTHALCSNAIMSGGTLVLELGFIGDADEFWFADEVAGTDINVFDLIDNSVKVGVANYALMVSGVNLLGTFLENQNTCVSEPGEGIATCISGIPTDGNNKVQWLGSTDILGGKQSTAYPATSDADLQAHAVPEPATLALLGLGLLGIGISAKRRKA